MLKFFEQVKRDGTIPEGTSREDDVRYGIWASNNGYNQMEDTTWITYVDVNSLYPKQMCKPLPTGKYTIRELALTSTERIRQCQEIVAKHDPNGGTGYFLEVTFSIPEELHDHLDFAPVASGLINPEWLSPLTSPDKTKNKKLFPYL